MLNILLHLLIPFKVWVWFMFGSRSSGSSRAGRVYGVAEQRCEVLRILEHLLRVLCECFNHLVKLLPVALFIKAFKHVVGGGGASVVSLRLLAMFAHG